MAGKTGDWRGRISSAMADEEVFTGEMFRKYLLRHAKRNCDSKDIGLAVVLDRKNPHIGGMTDGRMITVNAANSLVSSLAGTELKVLSMIGTVAHECGHINYTDMEKRGIYANGIMNGVLYPGMPEAANRREMKALEQLTACLKEKNESQLVVLQGILLYLHNIMEDIYVEARQCARFGGICRKGIRLNGKWDVERVPGIGKMMEAGMENLDIMKNVLLQYLRSGKVNDWDGKGKKYMRMLGACKKTMDRAVVSPADDDRYRAANRLLLPLWPFIRQAFRKPAEKNSMPEYSGIHTGGTWRDDGKGGSMPGKERMADALRELRETETAKITAGELAGVLEKIWKAAAAGRAEKVVVPFVKTVGRIEAERTEEFLPEELAGLHKSRKLYIVREEPGIKEAEEFGKIRKEIMETVRMMVRRVQPLLKEQDAGKEKGLVQGKRMDAGRLYRMDRRIFCNRNLPDGQDTVAAAVLLDESGSMGFGGRIEATRNTALILYLFCRQLHIPVRILGHSTKTREDEEETAEIYSYADFDSVDGRDLSRLMLVRDRMNNRDGAALAYAGAALAERTENIKLLFVISDGRPAGHGYSGEAARKDTEYVRKKLTKKGIRIIAAAIGADREETESIYGRGFLNISDMKRLPGALASLMGRYLER